ncbi:MAG: LLM class flavin-dependent oxidoreductase [Myxococcota bacterium]|nr:LLM class flavin-dependent oxidoreductase [Myxococcales bacterium]
MRPLDAGQVSLRIYPHPLPARACVEEMCAQARLAEQAGFAGLMTAEHHGGFPGYVPNPMQLAGFLLAATERLWAGPCPLLLPLRPWTHVVEEAAWLAARHPGRVAVGLAVGGLAQDFELADLDFAQAGARFREAAPHVIAALRGETASPLAEDPAVGACAEAPVPVVVAAQGPVGARRAARWGVGVLYDSLQTVERMAEVSRAHVEAGGSGARIAIRRVWIGPPPSESVAAQMDFYRGYASETAKAHWGEGQELVGGRNGAELAERLLDLARAGGCDAFNLRLHLRGVEPTAIREQIARLGEETLPLLARELPRI